MSRILITGGAGFIGSHLVEQLVTQGHLVTVVDNLSSGRKKFINSRAKFYKLSITNPKLKDIFTKERPEIVFHLAAQTSVPYSVNYPLADATNNIWGSLKVIENSLKTKVKKLIFTSTGGAIYGEAKTIPTPEITKEQPSTPYGLSKLTVDNYLLNYYAKVKKLNFVSLRLSNVYGPRQEPKSEAGVIAIFINNLLKNKPCYIFGSGRQTRDFIYINDVIDVCCKSIRTGQGIYNIGTAKETSITTLYHLIAGLISERKPNFKPAIAGEVFRSALKINKAKREFLWQPKTDLIKGIKKTIEYFK